MNDIKLTGLIGSNPLGALAAFGLLRVCSEIPDLSAAHLYWIQEYDWMAVLRSSEKFGKLELIEHLVEHQQSRKMDVFDWSRDIRVPPEEYKERLAKNAQQATLHDRLDADYFAAFGSEMITDGSKGFVKPTAFHMTSGQQKFLNMICSVAESLRSDAQKAFEEALFGPWRYESMNHSMGWDPSAERLHALRHMAPTDEHARCECAAVWLAIEALPLYPTTASGNALQTIGFVKTDRESMFVWPIWTPPIGIDTLRSLIMTSDKGSLEKRGVATSYMSIRSEFGKGYATLRPGTTAN
jgi:hypothetical protein